MTGLNPSVAAVLYEENSPEERRRIKIASVIALAVAVVLLVFLIFRFYVTGQLAVEYWFVFTRFTTWRFLGEGLFGTVKSATASMVLSFFAGLFLMTGRISRNRVVRFVFSFLIEFSRGVPTLLFVYFFFLFAPQFGLKLPSFWKITFAVSVSACGIVAETLRSGVNAVPAGQKEAALSLGLTESRVFCKIVLPQALRSVIPALIAELVIVLKDTTFSYIVNYADLMQNAQVLISNYDALLSVYLVTAAIYIAMNMALNKVSEVLGAKK